MQKLIRKWLPVLTTSGFDFHYVPHTLKTFFILKLVFAVVIRMSFIFTSLQSFTYPFWCAHIQKLQQSIPRKIDYLPVAVQFQDALLILTHFSIHTILCYSLCLHTTGALVQALLENAFTLSSLPTEYPEHSHLLPEAKDPRLRQDLRAQREGLSALLM